MPYLERLTDLSLQSLARFDDIIDVRSPAEFADDHLPGAINLPVLSNTERAMVGTIYKQESPFRAKRIGAAIVARNIAAHLDTALAGKPKSWRPLIYCWRGGMRSNAMATILSSVGWPVGLVDGGYKTWRREVVEGLERSADALPILLIDGQTGSGKTALLGALATAGGQVIDLEGLAHHRGSAFGGFADMPQPAQRLFESRLWQTLRQHDLGKAIFVEAESALVGKRRLPRRLWQAMLAAPRIELRVPVAVRAAFLVSAYGDAVADLTQVARALDKLKALQPKERLSAWRDLAETGAHAAFAEELIRHHYDPLYARSRKRREDEPVRVLDLPDLDAATLAAAAREILAD